MCAARANISFRRHELRNVRWIGAHAYAHVMIPVHTFVLKTLRFDVCARSQRIFLK